MSGHDKVTFLKKSVWIKNVFTGFDSDKHTLIGDKNIGITKIGETKLKTLRRAEIHFWCPDMIFSTFSKIQIFQDVQSISDEKEALKYVSTMSQASLGLNPCFLYPTFELLDVLTWCPDMILTWYQKMFWAHWLILNSWGLQLYCTEALFTHPGHFQYQPRPSYASLTPWSWHSHKRHQRGGTCS